MFTIIFYRKHNGESPIEDFLNSLDVKMRKKALMEIRLLKEFGNALRRPFSEPLGQGIFELRIQSANNISRILYFFYTGENIILTNGFIKKTQKTPVQEIAIALKYKADYESRKGD